MRCRKLVVEGGVSAYEASRQEAMREISKYIKIFYNHQRRQARLGYLSPAANEKNISKRYEQHRTLVSAIDDRPKRAT